MGKVDFLFKVLYVLLRECVIPINARMTIYKMMKQYVYYMDDDDKTIHEIC